MEQASSKVNISTDNELDCPPRTAVLCCHGPSVNGQGQVLGELLRRVPPLSSEELADILFFFVRLQEVYNLQLVADNAFIIQILPLVIGRLLSFLGQCVNKACMWKECRAQLFAELFPYVVREKLVRDLVVFNFHKKDQPLRAYIDDVFKAAEFLEHDATEQQIVDRVVMNFHPDIAAQAAFFNRLSSLKELYQVLSLIEERAAVAEERRKIREPIRAPDRARPQPHYRSQPQTNLRCWKCNQVGHRSRDCPQRATSSGNGQTPGGGYAPGRAS
jgi:hypothetical protein